MDLQLQPGEPQPPIPQSEGTPVAEPEPEPEPGLKLSPQDPLPSTPPSAGGPWRCEVCSTCSRCSPAALTHQSTAAEETGRMYRTKTSFARMEEEATFRNLREGQRVAEQDVEESDLTPTWDDKQMRGENVRWYEDQCLVSDPLWSQLTERERAECKKAVVKRRDAEQSEKVNPTVDSAPGADSPRGRPARAAPSSKTHLLDRQCSHQLPSILGASMERQGSARGGHGTVFRAVLKRTQNVAIKVPDRMDENKMEMNLFKDLRHPNLVACFGILNFPRGRRSIVTERCTTNLSAFLRRHDRWHTFHNERLTDDKIDECKYTILEHVCQGLQKLHEMSVLHRDLKCDNILLDGESGECEHCHHSGTWKICDFGEAKILQAPRLLFHQARPWKGGFDHRRFQPITAESLLAKGARWYCWLHPGETQRTAAGSELGKYSSKEGQALLEEELWKIGGGKKKRSWKKPDVETLTKRALAEGVTQEDLQSLQEETGRAAAAKAQQMVEFQLDGIQKRMFRAETELQPRDIIAAVLRHHNPYPYGALVYSFSEDKKQRHPRDCVFAVAAPPGSSATDTPNESLQPQQSREMDFPHVLKSFNLIPADELNEIAHHVHVDLETNTYRITRPKRSEDECPQITTLLSLFADRDQKVAEIKGKISQEHPIESTSALARRRQRIPERNEECGQPLKPPLQATHFVFAYQLPQWTTHHFTAEQLKDFDMYSGEISLASYGGFIYLNIPTDNRADAKVVGVNALSMGPRSPFSGGVVGCPDKNITPTVASPELWCSAFDSKVSSAEKSCVGLETDIYSFGIVMWEVFTRRQAWHWRRDAHVLGFKKLVATEHRRPKIPKGMAADCATMIRRCLHANPGRRPAAKELAEWIQNRRTKLQQQSVIAASTAVRERDVAKEDGAFVPSLGSRQWSITDRSYAAARCWHYGKFSQHHIMTTPSRKGAESDGTFVLTVNKCFALNDWEEIALQGDTDEYEINEVSCEDAPGEPDEPGLGIHWGDDWPTIRRIDECCCVEACKTACKRPAVAPEFPEIQVGCKLTEINGEPVETKVNGETVAIMTQQDAEPMLKKRPLRLKFSVPEHKKERLEAWPTAQWPSAEISDLPMWIQEGLKAIKKVAEHEAGRWADELSQARAEIAELKRQLAAAEARAGAPLGAQTTAGA